MSSQKGKIINNINNTITISDERRIITKYNYFFDSTTLLTNAKTDGKKKISTESKIFSAFKIIFGNHGTLALAITPPDAGKIENSRSVFLIILK